jgi:DNA-binding response OmpR family regulator
LLKSGGYNVVSELGFHRGSQACRDGGFDVFILGHSIPKDDKLDLIQCFREKNAGAPVIALTRPNEPRLKEIDFYLDPYDPAELLRSLAFLINPASERRRSRSSAADGRPNKIALV